MDANLFRYRIVDLTSRYENVYFDYPTPSVFMPIEIAKKLHNKPGKPFIYIEDGSFCLADHEVLEICLSPYSSDCSSYIYVVCSSGQFSSFECDSNL